MVSRLVLHIQVHRASLRPLHQHGGPHDSRLRGPLHLRPLHLSLQHGPDPGALYHLFVPNFGISGPFGLLHGYRPPLLARGESGQQRERGHLHLPD